MQPLDRTGTYPDEIVRTVLTSRYAPRVMRFRYDRLSSAGDALGPIDDMIDATVSNNALADIKRTASFTLRDRGTINYLSDRIKPWAVLGMPDGGRVEWPLGVFLLSTPPQDLGPTGLVTRTVMAYDQLVVLRDDKVTDRYSIADGVQYTAAIEALIAGVGGVTAAIVPSALALPAALEWDPGTPKLRILNDLLGAINYESAWFDEDGMLICRPYLSPASRGVEYVYSDDETSVRTGAAQRALDLFAVPNRWTVLKSEPDQPPLTSIYTNDNPSSPTSTVSRGRVIAADPVTESDAADQATLDAKAERLAFAASQVFEAITFSTMLMPMHSNADVYTLRLPSLGIDAKYGEHTWSTSLKAGAVMSHRARRVVAV